MWETYIDEVAWCDRIGRSPGLLISGLYDWWYEIGVTIHEVTHGDWVGNFAETEEVQPDAEEDDIYDKILLLHLPLVAICEAGPELFKSLEERPEDIAGLIPQDYRPAPTSPKWTRAELEGRLVGVLGYTQDTLDAMETLGTLATEFCVESRRLFESALHPMAVAAILKTRYVDFAERCVARRVIERLF